MASSSDPEGISTRLRAQAAQGGAYTTIAMIVGNAIGLLQLAIVARYLAPSDFGIFALGTVFLNAVTTFSSLGTEQILVQRPSVTASFVKSAWAVALIRGVVLSIVCLASGPLYSIAVGEPDAGKVLTVLAFVPIVVAVGSPHKYLANRRLQFRRLATFQIVTSIVQFGIVVWLAFTLRNAYALAWALVGGSAIQSVLTWLWFGIPGWPRLVWSSFRELISVGRHYLVIAVGAFVMTQADNLMVGAILGAGVLGLYVLAYKVSQFAIDVLNATLGRVALPVFSRLQGEPERLAVAFTEIWRLQIALLIPLSAGIALLADDIVPVLFGPQYMNAAKIMQVLALLTLSRGISHLLVPFIIGTGGIRFASKIKAFETIFFLIVVAIGTTRYGVLGAAWGTGIAYSVSAIARLIYAMKHLDLTAQWLAHSMAGVLCAAAIATLPALVLPRSTPLVDLLVAGTLFGIVYSLAALLLQRDLLRSIRRNLTMLRTT